MGTIMKIKQNNHHHIRIGLAYLSALLMLLLLFSVGFLLPSEVNAAAITCSSGVSGCHFNPSVEDGTARNVPSGLFTGSHARHSGYSTAAKREYKYACTKCHPSSGYTNSHQSGFKNITGSSITGTTYTGGRKIPNTNNPSFGNCSKIYCHSNGRGAGMGQLQYSSSKWGGTETCLGCHGGRNGSNNYARSVGNFTLTTTHSQHLKYPYTDINCQICHSKTATNAATLKNYTGVQRHANGVRDVYFTDIAYASYTSYKTSGADSGKCTNTSCHGGKTRGAWSATTTNNNYVCVHCHGIDGTTSGADRRTFAPGFRKQGTSTDQRTSSADLRVGSHFKHLSSVYMKNVKCNECHQVPSSPFNGVGTNHTLNTLRYNSATLTFAQSSSARILIGVASGSTPAQLAAFAGYTNGTAVKAATCSSVYCHGNRLKNNDTAGTYRKPYWNYSAMINYTQAAATVCARCHGYPPTYSGHSASTTCSQCHTNISAADNKSILNKSLHINGKVEALSGCIDCHSATQGTRQKVVGAGSLGVEGDDFMRPSRHVKGSGTSTAIVKNLDCVICHAEGDTTSTEASPVRHSTLHGDGTINLRDVDTPASNFTWPGKRAGGATITSTDRDNMDTFCMRCHDSDTSSATASRGGAYGISVASGNAALDLTAGGARRLTPFNTLDGGSALDVRGQFNYQNLVGSAWASHHNLNQFSNKRYTATYATTYSTRGGWTANTTKDGATLGWATGLHCSDCHLNEANAHGSRSTPRMLMTSAGTDATYTYDASSSTSTLVCFRCHLNTVYAGNATDTTKARLQHQSLDPKPMGTGYSADTRAVATCLNCHGGQTVGSIHGNNRSITPMGGTATKAYRFMYGSELGYGSMSDANWANTTQPSCYTSSGTWGGSCSSHNGGTSTGRIGAPQYSRPLQ